MDFFAQNQMYIVLSITLAIWIGVIFYLFKIEKKLNNLEKRN
ncbi:MAG: CcmD family protein [Bacteroidota bacterium]